MQGKNNKSHTYTGTGAHTHPQPLSKGEYGGGQNNDYDEANGSVNTAVCLHFSLPKKLTIY